MNQLERQWEAKRKEMAAAGLSSPAAATAPTPLGGGGHTEAGVGKVETSDLLVHTITSIPLKTIDATIATPLGPNMMDGGVQGGLKRQAEGEPGSPGDPNTSREGGGGSSRRSRRGAQVDYAALNAQLEAAEAALTKDKGAEGI